MSILNTSKTFQARDIWVGDSHSAFISAERLVPTGAPTADFSGISFWIGPQLAYSFRSDLLGHLESTLIRRAGLQQAIFVMGEIDVRIHLGVDPAKRRSDWVESYIDQTEKAARKLGCSRSILVGPVPPIAVAQHDDGIYPLRGTLESRVEATAWLQDQIEVITRRQKLPSISPLKLLADKTGLLRIEYALDGVHVNPTGARLVRQEVNKI